MSFDEVLKVMLPKQGDKSAHITGDYGEHRAKGPHGGTDFNYVGGQTGINLDHPTIHSPVAGKVEFVGGQYGTIKIRDAEGYSHEILHTHTQSVAEGQRVEAGQIIGTMGGRGPRGSEQYAQHVHYQLRDNRGYLLSPETFWEQRSVTQQQAPAMIDGLLKSGERGPEVRNLQEQLSRLGYRDAEGRALRPDGHFGSRTEEALRTFQRDYGLRADAVAGPETIQTLKIADQASKSFERDQVRQFEEAMASWKASGHDLFDRPASHHVPPMWSPLPEQRADELLQFQPWQNPVREPALLTDASHRDHALFQQAQAGVHKLDAQRGRTPDILSDQLAAALVVEAKREGMTRIDEVILGTKSENVIVRQSERFAVFDKLAHVNTVTGLNQSVVQSSEQLAQVGQEKAQQAMAAEQQRQHSPERSLGRAL